MFMQNTFVREQLTISGSCLGDPYKSVFISPPHRFYISFIFVLEIYRMDYRLNK